MDTQTPALIELISLSKIYPSKEGDFKALDNVSLSISAGEIYGIVGMSGAGKSTLIRCINRLDTPTSGDIFYRGSSILRMSAAELREERRKVAMIFQQFNLFMQRSVIENVCYPMDLQRGISKKQAKEKAEKLLRLVGLEEKMDAYPSQLSGGQKQRVAIARALAGDPEVLLCDEATSALDPMTTQSILALLQDINKRLGITVILITHEMAVIRQICTRVAILDGGKLAEEGTVDEVFLHTKSEAGRRLFGILPETPDEDPNIPALRIVFDGASRERPVIAEMILKTGIAINILSANMKHLRDKTYGQMLIEKPASDDETKLIVDMLTHRGLTVKEVRPHEMG